MYYCGKVPAPAVAVFFVGWLLLLFYTMSVVAEVFLCPAVQVPRLHDRARARFSAVIQLCCALIISN